MTERSYVVGLPVVLTIREDGSLLVEVDLSEASDLHDSSVAHAGDVSDAEIDADSALIEAAIEAGRVEVVR